MKLSDIDIPTRNFIMDCAEVVAKRISIEKGETPRFICESEAERRFTAPVLKDWVKKGYARGVKRGANNAKVMYDIIELEANVKAGK